MADDSDSPLTADRGQARPVIVIANSSADPALVKLLAALSKALRIRKWLIYLTLFLSALVLIGDLVVLVNGLLQGELTTAFILKVVSVFVVIGGIFLYYLWDVRRHSEPVNPAV